MPVGETLMPIASYYPRCYIAPCYVMAISVNPFSLSTVAVTRPRGHMEGGEPPVIETGREEPDPSAERLAYSVNEAARLTGLSRDLLYDQMRRGNLPYVKIGRRRLITRQHLEQFLGVAS